MTPPVLDAIGFCVIVCPMCCLSMYYNKVSQPCQLLFANADVAFKQHAAEEVHAPCLEQSDLFESKQFGHEPVPQPHGGQGHEQAQPN